MYPPQAMAEGTKPHPDPNYPQRDPSRLNPTQLYYLFFLFHSTALILLFGATAGGTHLCQRSWVPSPCSPICSLGFFWAVRSKSDAEIHLEKMLEREKGDSCLFVKCVEEMKRKSAEFDLLKEVDAPRRAKSLRVDSKPVNRWSPRDFATIFFFTVSFLVLVLTRVILCT